MTASCQYECPPRRWLRWSALAAAAALSILPGTAGAGEVRNPHFGVCTHFANKTGQLGHWQPETVIPLIADAGFGWIRDEILWRDIEKEKGVYQIPEKTRHWIDAANAANLKVLMIFNNANPIYDDPFDPEAFARAAAFVAKELKGKIQAIEVLNEPFNFDFAKAYGGGNWNGLDKDGRELPWVGKYVALLNQTAEAVTAADPDLPVIGLGSPAPVNFRQLAIGLSPKVRGMTDHPYSFRTVPEIIPFSDSEAVVKRDGVVTADSEGTFVSQVRMFRETSLKHSGPREIWHTEWGFSTFREGKPGRNPLYSGFSERAQAEYTLRRFLESLAVGVDKSFIYDFMDDGPDSFEPEHRFGLVDMEGKPKQAYLPVKRLMEASADLTPDDTLRVKVFPFSDRTESRPIVWDGITLKTTASIRWYAFRDAMGNPVVALWSTERVGDLQPRSADVELPFPADTGKVEIYDLMTGERTALSSSRENGKVLLKQLSVPSHPILIYPHASL